MSIGSDPNLVQVQNMVNDLLVDTPQFFVVDLRIKPTNNIRLFMDGDKGVTIEDCIRLNRKLYAQIEEQALYPDGNFSLEVSSPGVGEPLKLPRQFIKNTGRLLEVKLADDTLITGKLISAGENGFTLEVTTGKGKKAVTDQHEFDYKNIKQATVQIQF